MSTQSKNTETTTTATCPAWCGGEPHDPWFYDDGGAVIERSHELGLLQAHGVNVYLSAPERLTLDVDAIAAGGTIADTSTIERPAPMVTLEAPRVQELGAPELRQLIEALQRGLAIIEGVQ